MSEDEDSREVGRVQCGCCLLTILMLLALGGVLRVEIHIGSSATGSSATVAPVSSSP